MKLCLEDTIKVGLDYEQAPVEERAGIPTGGYTLIYEVKKTPTQLNLSLSFESKVMKKIKC